MANPREAVAETGRAGVAAVVLGMVAGGALVWFVGERRERANPNPASAQLAALESRLAMLETQQRTLASLALLPAPPRGSSAPDEAASADRSPPNYDGGATTALGGKPVEEVDAAVRRRTDVDDSAMARALERADRLSQAIAPTAAGAGSVSDAGTSHAAAPAAMPQADDEAARVAAEDKAAAEVVAEFNALLKNAGLERWQLLAARPASEERGLTAVIMAERGVRGVASGSLVADKLALERDPITGVAAFVASGAHGIEDGMEVHYEGSRYRIEIPGVLPVELVPPRLQELFGVGANDPALVGKEFGGDAAVVLVNRALALEKTVALRLRTVDRVEGDRYLKAVIDLEFDDSGAARQTVLADEAWFEVDPTNRYGELHCAGGEMVEEGQRRPLFRGRLRIPLRDLTPEHWKGVPGVRRVVGS